MKSKFTLISSNTKELLNIALTVSKDSKTIPYITWNLWHHFKICYDPLCIESKKNIQSMIIHLRSRCPVEKVAALRKVIVYKSRGELFLWNIIWNLGLSYLTAWLINNNFGFVCVWRDFSPWFSIQMRAIMLMKLRGIASLGSHRTTVAQ